MTRRNIVGILGLFFTLLFFSDCKKKKTEKEETDESFDKSAMLVNYADKIILPNFQSFQSVVDSLVVAFNGFAQQKNTASLNALRKKYISAYLKFQRVAAFEYGPSESENVRTNFNTFPVNINQVNSNINSGNYDLGTVDNIAAKGFPAIDYLLFGENLTDSSIVAQFSTDPSAARRITYLDACITEMQSKINIVVAAWSNGYKTTFVNSTGSQIGSSLGLMINQLNFEIDLLKNSKIGIPLGKKSLGLKLPEKCEAFYANKISVALAKECLLNIENIYLGRSTPDTDGLGIDDYLQHLGAMHGSVSLNEAIKNQFTAALTKLNLVDEPLSSSINSQAAAVDAAYLELVKLLVLLKTDAPSALGVIITYQDGDGD
ncbi:MAG TPA: imelysin family protein [Bacteroidia bacterium]|nr:imelysin family protein [Bacteroidia bacterium]